MISFTLFWISSSEGVSARAGERVPRRVTASNDEVTMRRRSMLVVAAVAVLQGVEERGAADTCMALWLTDDLDRIIDCSNAAVST